MASALDPKAPPYAPHPPHSGGAPSIELDDGVTYNSYSSNRRPDARLRSQNSLALGPINMRMSDKKLLHDLEVLRHGGDEAVELFFEMGKKFFRKGGIDYLDNWIGVAAPSLPERDRHAVMSALMRTLFAGPDTVRVEHYPEQPTLQ